MHQLLYCLKDDLNKIKMIQEASLDPTSRSGFKIVGGVLFGTTEWFELIEAGKIQKYVEIGVISRVFMSGHNDYAEFEVNSTRGKTIWPRLGDIEQYKVGTTVKIEYVEQPYKRPSDLTGAISKVVYQIDSISN